MWARALIFFAAMVLSAQVGNVLSVHRTFSTMWLPAGVYVAVLLIEERRDWPTFIATAIVANLASDLVNDRLVATALMFSIANSAEAILGASLVGYLVGRRPRLRSQSEAIAFTMLAGLVAPAVGALLGTAVVVVTAPGANAWTTWYMWWASDALGVIVAGSAVLTGVGRLAAYREDDSGGAWRAWRPILTALAIGIPTSLISYVVFAPQGGGTSWKFLASPGILASGIIGGPAGAAASFLLVAVAGIAGMVSATPTASVATSSVAIHLFQAEAFFVVWGVCSVILAAVTVENRAHVREALDAADRFRMLFNAMREGVAHLRVVRNARGRAIDGEFLEVNDAFPLLTGVPKPVGQRVNEAMPDLRITNPEVFEVFGEVAETGESRELESLIPQLDRILRFSITSPGPGEALAVFEDATERATAEKALAESNRRFEKMVYDVAAAMGSLVEARDPYTQGHQLRVAMLARVIGAELGLSAGELDELGMASLLHDIGKLRVPAEILTKPGKLSDVEMSLIREHPDQGYETLRHIDFPWRVADIVRQHHERMDGSGYPGGLVGDEILLPSRILAAADVIEAIASHRPYRAAIGLREGIEEIRSHPERFDPEVSAACARLYERGVIDVALAQQGTPGVGFPLVPDAATADAEVAGA